MKKQRGITTVLSDNNLHLFNECMKEAEQKLSDVLRAGGMVRETYTKGRKNYATFCSSEKSLEAAIPLIDRISQNRTKSRIRFFGQHISDSISLLKGLLAK